VRTDFYRDADGSTELVGSATWSQSGITVEARTDDARSILARVLRPTPVAVDDPSLRSFGASGEVVLQPGSVRWFMAAARTRGQDEGLRVRFVADGAPVLGWDPAGAYRTFTSSAERLGGGSAV
jgi:hypothetical protein